MRLFIAIPLPKNILRTAFAAEQELQKASTSGRFVPEGNHHITVRFLGESDALADIADAMHEAVKDARPFLLRLGKVGHFTHSGTKTCYIGVEGETDEYFRIFETLEAALFEYGFAGGKVRFTPHITLARAVELSGDISRVRVPNAGFTVRSIVLFESTNENGRMVYTPVHTETF